MRDDMARARGNAVCGGIIGLAALYAAARGDIAFAAPMFFVSICFARWANRDWKRAQ